MGAASLAAPVCSPAAADPPNRDAIAAIIMSDSAIAGMTTTNATRRMRGARGAALARNVALMLIVVLIVPISVVAIGSGIGLVALPYQMFELASRAPLLFPAHMISSALALLLAPLVVAVRRYPEFHRPLGRLLGVFVVIGGLTALPVAVMSHSPVEARAGFFVQGIVWMSLLFAALQAIREHHVERHAHLMLAMVAVTSGAVWFRLLTGTAIVLHMPFDTAYVFAAWAGWIVPLALVSAYSRRTPRLAAR